MKIYDALYGEFFIPKYLSGLLETPEMRRLSQVRLLNSSCTSLSTLSELRRFSHSLGVYHLARFVELKNYPEIDKRAFLACALLHDIGTPPFGHLLEYHLNRNGDWNHEENIIDIIRGKAVPENRAHQIFGGRTISVHSWLKKNNFSLDIIEAILRMQHPLSHLLFGRIDLDNIDNISRMSWALSIKYDITNSIKLASLISINNSNEVLLPLDKGRKLIDNWSSARKSCYDILLFDSYNMAAQALMFDIMYFCLNNNILSKYDWDLNDETLLFVLLEYEDTKEVVQEQYFGHLPEMLFIIQLSGTLQNYGFCDIISCKKYIESKVNSILPEAKSIGYVHADRGTFDRKKDFFDFEKKLSWSHGKNSESIILYSFLRSKINISNKKRRKIIDGVLEGINVQESQIIQLNVEYGDERNYGQQTFYFKNKKN